MKNGDDVCYQYKWEQNTGKKKFSLWSNPTGKSYFDQKENCRSIKMPIDNYLESESEVSVSSSLYLSSIYVFIL